MKWKIYEGLPSREVRGLPEGHQVLVISPRCSRKAEWSASILLMRQPEIFISVRGRSATPERAQEAAEKAYKKALEAFRILRAK